MNLRQYKRRHAQKLTSRPPEWIRLYRIHYSTPVCIHVDVQVRMVTSPPPFVLEPGQWDLQEFMDQALAKLGIEASRVYP